MSEATRPISRLLASELTDIEIDMVSGAACQIYTRHETRDRYGQCVDCTSASCDDPE